MTRRRKFLLALLAVLLLAVLVPAAWFSWRARRALPLYDGDLHVTGLRRPVRILRDERAVPHIYAQNLEDLLFAQGYVHAQERLWQMDLLRRTARGRLAEIFGAAAVPIDKENRLLGLGSVADRTAEAMDQETRRPLEAYAQGVNAFIASHSGSPYFSPLPIEFALLRYHPEPWTIGDTVAVELNLFTLLTSSWRRELSRAQISAQVGPERAADLYPTRSDRDHPIAEPVQGPKRPRRERTFVAHRCRHGLELLSAEEPLESVAASNNWVAAGSHTASGAALLANDMHLGHGVPAIWFMIHLQSPEVDVMGFSAPGLAGVVAGHNQRIAWGYTNSNADVQDLFIERFNPEDPTLYMTPTGWAKVQRRREHISVRGGEDVELEVLETRHGPIVHDDGQQKLALAWTARDPARVAFSLLSLNQAQNWEEFLRALAGFRGPPQNVIYADADGNIGYHMAGQIPLRRAGHGQVPVPGDTNVFDWLEDIPFEALPHALNPPEGILATANNRTIPDGYPYYITDQWISPARIERIYQLLQEDKKFTPEDFLRIQGDIVSLPDRFLAAQLVAAGAAIGNHPPERAQALAALNQWDGAMQAELAAPLLVHTARARLGELLLRPLLGDDYRNYSWFMSPVALENLLTQRPERWLTKDYPSYDALLLKALDLALEQAKRDKGATTLAELRWGDQWRVRFAHPFGERVGVLRRWFSVGGEPQSGGPYSVKQTHRAAGVSERLVVDFADLDCTLMNITLGQSGHVASPHYRDQFQAWLEVRSFPAPFSEAAVERAARHTLHLLPR
ncbi:MAG: penicillin acylase family protein [Candidatus Acidiferrales bacterium]